MTHDRDDDWVIYFGICIGYALGPYTVCEGSPFPASLGVTTDHPQLALGFATREAAEAAVTTVARLCGDASVTTMDGKPAKVEQRHKAIARWRKGIGANMGTVDWGTLYRSGKL